MTYSAILLDEKSQLTLTTWAEKNVKVNGVRLPILVRDAGWKMICHHMTIQYPGIPEYVKQYLDTIQQLEVTHVGADNKVIAVRVVGFPSTNRIPHITVAINTRAGGRPVMSNDIKDWTSVDNCQKLKGRVVEIKCS